MILLSITLVLLVGSVAATNTTSDDVSTLQKVSSQQSRGSISSTTNSQKTQTNTAAKTAAVTTQSTTTTTDNTTTTSKTTPQNNVLNTTTTQQTTNVSTTTKKSLKSSTANKAATRISVTPIRTDSGKTTKIKATVTTTNKIKVTTGEIAFKINGKTIGRSTVTKGYSSLTYKIPAAWNNPTYKITAVYGENSKYKESTGTGTLYLNNVLPTKTTVTQTTTSDKKITIKATVTTDNYKKVTGGKVAFKINGKTIGRSTVSKGVATLTYTVPSSWTAKSYKITAVYGQYYQYKESTGKATLNMKSLKTSTVKSTTKISIPPIRANRGKTTKIKATITTSGGSKVTTGKLAFKINGKTIGYSTVSKGYASLKYKIPSSWKDPRYTLTAVYGENTKYKSSKGMTTLYLNNVVPTKTTVTKITTNPGKKITIKATVTTNGIKMYGGKVAFKINGKTIGRSTVSKGVATLTYTVPSSWTAKSYKITAVYGQYYQYRESTGKATLKVVKSSSVPAGYRVYLKATRNCQVTNAKIIRLAKRFNNTYQNTYSKARAIFNYLNDKTSYSGYMNTRYGAVNTLIRGYGNCVDMAHLMIAVSRASGIPARYCHSTCYFRSGLVIGHVWAEVYVSGKWYKCDLTSNSNSFGKIVNWYSCIGIRRYISLPF